MKPALGRIVHYLLSEADKKEYAERVNTREAFLRTQHTQDAPCEHGHDDEESHAGADVVPPDRSAAWIIGPSEMVPSEETPVTLMVVTESGFSWIEANVKQGTTPGTWHEPPRV